MLVRMELLKLVKRPMTWILLVLLCGGIGFGSVVGLLNLRSVEPEIRESILRNLTLPEILPQTTRFTYVFGSIMLSILAASSIGSEYGWGTLRPFLAIGMSRSRFILAKFVALAIVSAAFVALPLIMNALFAIPVGLIGNHPIFSGTADAAFLGSLAAMVGRTYLLVLMPVTLAFAIGLIGRSQAAGIGVALGMMIGQLIVAELLSALGIGWIRALIDFFPISSSESLLRLNSFEPVPLRPGLLSESRALLTLGAYSIICVVVSLLVFRRRDVRGSA